MKFLWILPVLGMGAIGWKAGDVRPIVNPPIRQESLDIHEEEGAASLLGQFRSGISSWLWLRADLYLHNGVEMRPLTQAERSHGVSAEEAHEDGHEKLHQENVVTTVPPRGRDFRGIFGDVERAVSSYRDMHGHDHNDPSQALPLYRLMTWLDPQFVQGWTAGGMILARDRSEAGTQRALDFLGEGWRVNPASVDLPNQIGYTLATRRRDLERAISYFEAARQNGLRRWKSLGDTERDALENAYRWLALSLRDLDRRSDCIGIASEGHQLFTDDVVLERLSRGSGPADHLQDSSHGDH